MITTIHGFSSPRIRSVYRRYDATTAYVAISDADRDPDLNYLATIHHGIDTDAFSLGEADGGYLLFFGRIHRDRERRRRSTSPWRPVALVIDGIVDDERYFDERVAPRLDGEQVVFHGAVSADERSESLGGADALLHLISFDEPSATASPRRWRAARR